MITRNRESPLDVTMNSISSMVHMRGRHVAAGLQNTSYSTATTAQIDMDKADEQSKSLLFSKLPLEIRLRIFEYAVVSVDDLTKPYIFDRVYYRPGYHYHQKTEITLLLTCKRIFEEARFMPVARTEHTFWLFGGPSRMMRTWVHGLARFDAWTVSLNEDQRQAVDQVHLFAQQAYLEGLGQQTRLPPLAGITTKRLTLTFRHSDWWSWQSPPESSDKLGICPWLPGRVSQQTMLSQPLKPDLGVLKEVMKEGTWGHQIRRVRGLSVLKIEFETDVVKKAQLQQVLERAKYWMFPLSDTSATLVQVGEFRDSSWEGLADLKDDSGRMLNSGAPINAQSVWDTRPKRTYYVAEMTWRRVRTTE